MVVYKQLLTLSPFSQETAFPRGATLLSAKEQQGLIAVWALCDPAATEVIFEFVVLPTGLQVPDFLDVEAFKYLGTTDHEGYISHVFGKEVA